MELQLRSYQRAAVNALFGFFRANKGNPLLVAPTGSGKSVILAAFAKEALELYPQTRVVVASHRKELLVQDGKWLTDVMPMGDIGYLSAGLGGRDFDAQVLLAGVQTAYNKPSQIGHVDLLIIDEAHLLSNDDNSMYRKMIRHLRSINPALKVIGMTATPYRLSSGVLYGGEDDLFDDIAYNIPIQPLIEDGHLCRMVGRRGIACPDLANVHMRGGEFVAGEVEEAFDISATTARICRELASVADKGFRGVLVFASGVKHAYHIKETLSELTGERVEVIEGETPSAERDDILQQFAEQQFRWLVNVGVLTTGFDAPHVDLIALARATKSTGLYVQIAGRGMRPAPGKERCIMLDYGGNIERHGPVDMVDPHCNKKGTPGEGEAPIKECPECLALLHLSTRLCPECGHEFPPPAPTLETTASNAAVMSDEAVEVMEVYNINYRMHRKEGKPPSMRVEYDTGGNLRTVREWVCFEHQGYARRKAELWAETRKISPPATVEDALEIEWPPVSKIKVNTAGRFPELLAVELGAFAESERESIQIDDKDADFAFESGSVSLEDVL